MTPMRTTMALLALTTLTACDNVGKSSFSKERAEGTYRAAMSDYQAGRLDQAIKGFKKACVANPANASARFQLACLLQDSVKDYMGAFCAYREYLLQCPSSDKARIAADRLAVCEREMAKELTEKYASRAVQEAERSAQEANAARIKSETELAKTRAALEAANQQLEALRLEHERLKTFIRDEAEPETAAFHKDELAAAKALMDQESRKVVAEDDDLAAAKRMVEDDTAEPPPLIVQVPDAKAKRTVQQEAQWQEAQKNAKAADSGALEQRPETYVVQEGDTLYKIAVRFYGRASAWQRIRAANRATISTDGRLRVGQKITLPDISQ